MCFSPWNESEQCMSVTNISFIALRDITGFCQPSCFSLVSWDQPYPLQRLLHWPGSKNEKIHRGPNPTLICWCVTWMKRRCSLFWATELLRMFVITAKLPVRPRGLPLVILMSHALPWTNDWARGMERHVTEGSLGCTVVTFPTPLWLSRSNFISNHTNTSVYQQGSPPSNNSGF